MTHKGIPIRITADLSIEILQARREWKQPARISFRYEGEFKSFTDKQKLREFSTNKPAL